MCVATQYVIDAAVLTPVIYGAADTDPSGGVIDKHTLVSGSGPSAPRVRFCPVPASAVVGLAVGSVTGTTIELTWSVPADDGGLPISGYSVRVDGSEVAVPAASPYTVGSLAEGTTYTLEVCAVTQAGVGACSSLVQATAVGATPPGAPSAVRLVSNTEASVTLEWDAPASDGGDALTQYEVEFTSGGSGTACTVTDGTVLNAVVSCTVASLSASTGYGFRVRAVNGQGAGGWSGSASVWTACSIAARTYDYSLALSGAGTTDYVLDWTCDSGAGEFRARATAKKGGWVGLGLGGSAMAGSDYVLGWAGVGCGMAGTSGCVWDYREDSGAVASRAAPILEAAAEQSVSYVCAEQWTSGPDTFTSIEFVRSFSTGDAQDVRGLWGVLIFVHAGRCWRRALSCGLLW